ncbi:MAG TPA: AEC family transporter [Syntrophorhabdaceae bacterium]|nr:AEC family transporter [Syntrophorhabdaceae bacterium]
MHELPISETLSKIAPIVLSFFLGFFLKKRRLFTPEHAEIFLKLIFYVALPPLVLLSVLRTELSLELFYLPVTCIIVVLVAFPIVRSVGSRSFHLNRPSLGVFIVGPLIVNTTFVLPFLLAAYGPEAIARLSIFDVGNNIMIYSLAYYSAHRYGSDSGSRTILKVISQSPLLYALLLGLILNAAKVSLPPVCLNFFHGLADMVTPLVMLSLGIYFSPAVTRIGPTFASIAIRMAVGFFTALICVSLLGVHGLSRVVILVASAAPVGFTTLTFAAITGLNTELAASCVSYSILIGLLTTPLIIFFVSH